MKTFEEAVEYYAGTSKEIRDRCDRFKDLNKQIEVNETVNDLLAGVACVGIQEQMLFGGTMLETLRVSIERHDYGTGGYPGQLVLQDALTLHGSQFKDVACIVASPPCTEYSYMAMPWSRGKQIAAALCGQGSFPERYRGSRSIEQLNALFNACFRIQGEASEAAGHHIPMVVENVKGAQPWVGQAAWNFGSFYLWGDVPALMPMVLGRRFKSQIPATGKRFDERIARTAQEAAALHYRLPVDGRKVPMNFHEHEKTGKPGRSFQSAAVEAVKVSGIKLADVGFNVAAAQRVDATQKPETYVRSEDDRRQHIGFTRKAASAAIAKIPFALANHIARCLTPALTEAK